MSMYILLILVFISVSGGVYFLFSAMSGRNDQIAERLRRVESMTAPLQEQFISLSERERSNLDPKMLKLLAGLGKNVKGDASAVRTKLIRAGYRKANAAQIFFGSKIFLAFILFALPATFAVLRHQGFLMVLAAFGAAAIGYLLPDNIVSKKIRKRQEAINSGLPDALDFLVICVEAGLGLNTALVRVGKEMMTQCREFSEELLMVNQEMLSGLSRTQALHNLAERNQSKYLRVLVSAITISDRLGTDIADTLRAQSDSLRTQFRQQTEEQAAKSGLKMLLPLALFIFPTLFIIILGPAVINLIQTVFPNMNR